MAFGHTRCFFREEQSEIHCFTYVSDGAVLAADVLGWPAAAVAALSLSH